MLRTHCKLKIVLGLMGCVSLFYGYTPALSFAEAEQTDLYLADTDSLAYADIYSEDQPLETFTYWGDTSSMDEKDLTVVCQLYNEVDEKTVGSFAIDEAHNNTSPFDEPHVDALVVDEPAEAESSEIVDSEDAAAFADTSDYSIELRGATTEDTNTVVSQESQWGAEDASATWYINE